MKHTLVFILCMGLSACFSVNTKKYSTSTNEAPSAHVYTNQAHPLGIGESPSPQNEAYAFMLLAKSQANETKRAQQACRALFSVSSDDTQSRIETYLPVNKHGDFTRVSARFKWGMCSRLKQLADTKRESELLNRIGYTQTRGPILVAVDQPFSKQLTQSPLPAIVADLSMVPAHELGVVVHNWLEAVSADGWDRHSDLGELAEALNQGLESRRVAISRMPEKVEEGLALR